ncbi:MAG: leucine-rich repeat domain-containing protein [Verrucomicrobiota bacterium]|nr:leucine-rich repeat domain-containing protein [Verrucomicrobiota bacterium]
MKRVFFLLGLLGCALVSVTSALLAVEVTDAVVTIPDANLASQVKTALGLADTAEIHESDMLKLQALYLEQPANSTTDTKKITNLSGLEKATNLEILNLQYNKLIDTSAAQVLQPLSGLSKLRYLDLSGNQIQNISPLKGLTNLEVLGLTDNEITNVTDLGALTNLIELYLGWNSIELTDSSNVKTMKYLSDISALAPLTKLERFFAENNDIHDFSAVLPSVEGGNPKLVSFGAMNTRFDGTALRRLANAKATLVLIRLEGCQLSTSDVEDVLQPMLAGAPNLHWLQIDRNYAAINLESAAQAGLKAFSSKYTFSASDQKIVWEKRLRNSTSTDWITSSTFGFVYAPAAEWAFLPAQGLGWLYIFDRSATPSGFYFYHWKDATFYWTSAFLKSSSAKRFWAYNFSTNDWDDLVWDESVN